LLTHGIFEEMQYLVVAFDQSDQRNVENGCIGNNNYGKDFPFEESVNQKPGQTNWPCYFRAVLVLAVVLLALCRQICTLQ
jgi:hypothetical protein